MFRQLLTRLVVAALIAATAAITAPVSPSPLAQAATAPPPELRLPFRCRSVWRASTYASITINGVTHVHGNAVDFNMLTRTNAGALVTTADRDQPVVAAAAGRVTSATPSTGTVVIDHGGGWKTLYAHMADLRVATGAWVSAGQFIGRVNRVGFADGDHLHFELLRDGTKVLPTFDGAYANVSPTRTQDFTSGNCLPGEHGLWFANSLLRAPDGTIDWVTPSGERYWVPNWDVVRCLQASGATLRPVSAAEFGANPRNRYGDPGGRWADCSSWTIGWMLKGSGPSVWYVAPNGLRYHVPDEATVMCLGGWAAIRPVSDAVLDQVPANAWGLTANCRTPLYGEMVKGSGAAVYFVGPKGTKYHVPSSAVVDCLGGWPQVVDVRDEQLSALPANPWGAKADCNAPLFDRLMRRADGTVDYVTGNKVRYWVPNGTVVSCLGGWPSVVFASDSRFASMSRNSANSWATCSTKV